MYQAYVNVFAPATVSQYINRFLFKSVLTAANQSQLVMFFCWSWYFFCALCVIVCFNLCLMGLVNYNIKRNKKINKKNPLSQIFIYK